MGNAFKAVLASGGNGYKVTVTCDSEFAGLTITCSNGTTSYTQTCPSSSPYVVEFTVLDVGTWTISGTASGIFYDTTVTVQDVSAVLDYGFNWRAWVNLSQNYEDTDFTDLEDVFDNEEAVRELMTIHASADYLIDKVTRNPNDIDPFCANDTAMKWIGLRDYVCDSLTAISGVWAKFLASNYWERILKDHVPVMTSHTAPYGTVDFTSQSSTAANYGYKIFDGDYTTIAKKSGTNSTASKIIYRFPQPIDVRKMHYIYTNSTEGALREVHVQYGDITGEWEDALVHTFTVSKFGVIDEYLDIPDCGYHRFWCLYITSHQELGSTAWANYGNVLQFYGRSLNVFVPAMTSNTEPFGQVSASTEYSSSYLAWMGVDNNESDRWNANSAADEYLEYDFKKKVKVKAFLLQPSTASSRCRVKNYMIQASNDNSSWTTLYTGVADNVTSGTYVIFDSISSNTEYRYYRCYVVDNYDSAYYVAICRLNFYGVDYTEREFATGSNIKYLYDHGLELETGTVYKYSSACTAEKRTNNMYYEIPATSSTYAGFYWGLIDFTNYSLARIIGDDVFYTGNVNAHVAVIGIWPSTSGMNSTDNSLAWASVTGNTSATIGQYGLSIDLSSVSGSNYIAARAVNGTSNLYARKYNFNELWLE